MAVRCTLPTVFLFFTVTVTISEAAECGVTVGSGQRIVGGESVTEYTYPWFAAIIQKNDYSEMNVICGGSLITDKHVVTAAHCFPSQSDSTGSGYRVVFKLYNRCDASARGDSVGIAKVNVSPKYVQSTMEGDIAIITLANSVDNSPVCLPQPGSNHRGGSSIWSQLWKPVRRRSGNQVTGDAVVIGFGSTKVKSRYPCYMQEAHVKILSSRECRNTNLPRPFREVPNTFCAGIQSGGIDSCDGDSGGPLMTVSTTGWYTIQGITSFGEGCGRRGLPGIYTQVSAYRDWIDTITKQTINNDYGSGTGTGTGTGTGIGTGTGTGTGTGIGTGTGTGTGTGSSNRPSRPPYSRPPQQFPFLPPFSQIPSFPQIPSFSNFPGIFSSLFPSRKSSENEQSQPSSLSEEPSSTGESTQ